MANATAGNVVFVDTTAYTDSRTLKICGVKYIGNTNGTAVITDGTAGTGTTIWQENGAANLRVDEIEARVNGFHVALTNGAKVIIYLES